MLFILSLILWKYNTQKKRKSNPRRLLFFIEVMREMPYFLNLQLTLVPPASIARAM